ncbi:MAG: alpha-2-macroglobulin, partial [Planctomycetaceae bacterium]|nr:alpha-2-macroglobulin [Planctomycetaceae bacterium]
MKRMKKLVTSILVLAVAGMSLVTLEAQQAQTPSGLRARAQKLQRDGNWKEAYELFARLAKKDSNDLALTGGDLSNAVSCLGNIGRYDQADEFIEAVIKARATEWRVLQAAAQIYLNALPHYGYTIAGKFERGDHRGGGQYIDSYERDRVRSLQLMQQAMEQIKADDAKYEVASFYDNLSQMLMGNRGWMESWRLQYLTNLKELPDYGEGADREPPQGAPVDEQGNPVYHTIPKSWADATSDGQRWRWALSEVVRYAPDRISQVDYQLAQFFQAQFGVQTLQEYRWFFGRFDSDDGGKKNESGTWALHTLGEDETIAKLATGIKRFNLPKEFNYIRIYQRLADSQNGYASSAMGNLCQEFENRRQYPKAAELWRANIKRFGDDSNQSKQKRLTQVVGNWGLFEPIMTQPSGKGATVEYRYRNGKKVSFEAFEIKIPALLEDVKAYIKRNPRRMEYQKINIADIGYRLVYENEAQYIGAKVAGWDLDLMPRAAHFDKRITVATPLQKAGAYLLTAKMEDGNVSRIIIWIADTAIVNKPLDKKTYYYICDAADGSPIAKANVEFFGYRQRYVQEGRGQGYSVFDHKQFAELTDEQGQLILGPDQLTQSWNWLITATTPQGRLAYMGFQGMWYPSWYDQEYNATKTFAITDRPVYRPLQNVKFKFWVNNAKYDQEGKSAFAGHSFTVQVNNPKGEKIFEKTLTADEYGGMDGELTLPKEAALGVYGIFVMGQGGGSFRVEEYKKPEFEVKVDAPTDPIMLGEKIEAKITAKYYFGAPVTKAKVKYKVLRTTHESRWYPICRWDWFYGSGYWWYAYDYTWYPGWYKWGCPAPLWSWWPMWRAPQQPELVSQATVPVGPDGVVKVQIDTAVAKAIHGDKDHRYEITAEVTDESRRTITGTGAVLVAREPFKVYTWVGRGHYRVGDSVEVGLRGQRLDGKGVKGAGKLKLLAIKYEKAKPVETVVQQWDVNTDDEGNAKHKFDASRAGQYRLAYALTDSKGHSIEGGYVFTVIGEGTDGRDFRFNQIELVTDKQEYKPGEKVALQVNTEQPDSTVLLFVRAANSVYQPPKIIRLKGKTVQETVEVVKKDMPNFFIEAVTVSGGKMHNTVREVVVPPEKRVLDVKVTPSAEKYKPGQKASVTVKLTEPNGEPYSGSTVIAMYDKAVEYISGGSNVPDIKEFFWKWRRHHQSQGMTSLSKGSGNLLKRDEIGMSFLGIFGYLVVEEVAEGEEGQTRTEGETPDSGFGYGRGKGDGRPMPMAAKSMRMRAADGPAMEAAAPAAAMADMAMNGMADKKAEAGLGGGQAAPMVQPTVRTNFADTAFWAAAVQTGKDGTAKIELTMPENLTTWKTKVWAMGEGTKCGEGFAEVITTKDLIVRLQAPRFFVQKDEVVLSANVHNYLKSAKKVKVALEIDELGGAGTTSLDAKIERKGADLRASKKPGWELDKTVEVPAGGETRVDWRIRVDAPGEIAIRMKALTDEESDAMEQKFPVYVHGMLKTESFSGALRPEDKKGVIDITVPAERRPDESRLEIRYSPTLAGAMVDALPYLMEYPYGCTEQTLNRFLPTVITRKVLIGMGLDLKAIKEKRSNLNAQEIGNDVERAKQWQRQFAPVFDDAVAADMAKAGVEKLLSMQCSDGGWGWFSGWGEHSWPHTTAVVVHGLRIAQDNDLAVPPAAFARGVEWLKNYQAQQVRELKNAKTKTHPWKETADNLDAFVYMVLVDEKSDNKDMREFLYRDRNHLSVYAKAMFALACHKVKDIEKRDMLRQNIEQFLIQDDENQTAYLRLGNEGYWWCWYGSEYEAQGYYLKLLAAADPKGKTASRLVKYLLNNRKHATYWNSTRDTAIIVEAFGDYIRASGEDKPDLTVQILI